MESLQIRFVFELFLISFTRKCITCSCTNDHIKVVDERLTSRGRTEFLSIIVKYLMEFKFYFRLTSGICIVSLCFQIKA